MVNGHIPLLDSKTKQTTKKNTLRHSVTAKIIYL